MGTAWPVDGQQKGDLCLAFLGFFLGTLLPPWGGRPDTTPKHGPSTFFYRSGTPVVCRKILGV